MRLATLAFALGPAALALGFGLSGDPEPAADRPAATGIQAAAPARADGPPEFAATANLERARERLDALDPGADQAGFVRALRDLERAIANLGGEIAAARDEAKKVEWQIRTQDSDNKRLIAALISASRAGLAEPSRIHPDGPVAAARAAALLAPAESELVRHAAALGGRLRALAAAQELREEAETILAEGVGTLADAGDALRLAAFADAPPADPGPPDPRTRLAALARDSDSLGALARGLAAPVPRAVRNLSEVTVASAEGIAATDGVRITRSSRNLGEGALLLEMPVSGSVALGFGERDAGGAIREGLTLAAAPRSVVTAPAAGEVRYVGPFLDYQTVVAIAPADDTVIVLAGLTETLVAPGDLVPLGTPLGFLGGRAAESQEFLMPTRQGSDAPGAETLYMELWRGGKAIDPGPLLGLDPGSRNG